MSRWRKESFPGEGVKGGGGEDDEVEGADNKEHLVTKAEALISQMEYRLV